MRKKVPTDTREKVLREFNHLCSMCASVKPQIHHIDGNNSNNDELNLLPLCPNCHLNDQHSPTASLDKIRVGIFRRFKDPLILTSQFSPLFSRMRFLFLIQRDRIDSAFEYWPAILDLTKFMSEFKMGKYFSEEVLLLSKRPTPIGLLDPYIDTDKMHQLNREADKEYVNQLLANIDRIVELILEMIKYQEWNTAKKLTTN